MTLVSFFFGVFQTDQGQHLPHFFRSWPHGTWGACHGCPMHPMPSEDSGTSWGSPADDLGSDSASGDGTRIFSRTIKVNKADRKA